MRKTPEDLLSYCGLYCGACGIHQGRIKQAVENIRRIIGAYGFDKIAPELAKWEPAFQHYEEYEKVLDGFIKVFGECPGCLGGGGDPQCAIRRCCKQKAHSRCAECQEIDSCTTIGRFPKGFEESRRIQSIGLNKWLKEMLDKVEAGYCYLDEKLK